jgi:hypothetical protein
MQLLHLGQLQTHTERVGQLQTAMQNSISFVVSIFRFLNVTILNFRVHDGSGKAHTTVLLTIGADATCLPPYIIYKSLRLYDTWCPKNVIPGAVFNGTDSGWIDENCFYDYLSKLFIPKTRHLPRPPLLIIDNHSTHLSIKTAKLAIQSAIAPLFLCVSAIAPNGVIAYSCTIFLIYYLIAVSSA